MPDGVSKLPDRWSRESISAKLWEIANKMNQDPVDSWTRERIIWLANELHPPHGLPYSPTPAPNTSKDTPINA